MAGQGHKIDLCSQRANILAHGFELGWVCECVRDRLGTGHFECPRTWLVSRMRLDCRASGTVCRSRVIARPEHRRVAQEAETNAVLLDDHRPPCLGERFADAAMKDPDCVQCLDAGNRRARRIGHVAGTAHAGIACLLERGTHLGSRVAPTGFVRNVRLRGIRRWLRKRSFQLAKHDICRRQHLAHIGECTIGIRPVLDVGVAQDKKRLIHVLFLLQCCL